jgi:hypothetical protein
MLSADSCEVAARGVTQCFGEGQGVLGELLFPLTHRMRAPICGLALGIQLGATPSTVTTVTRDLAHRRRGPGSPVPYEASSAQAIGCSIDAALNPEHSTTLAQIRQIASHLMLVRWSTSMNSSISVGLLEDDHVDEALNSIDQLSHRLTCRGFFVPVARMRTCCCLVFG